jgi:hypothetical protein
MKNLMFPLMISFLLILSGCSQRVVYKQKEVPVLTPDFLLLHPCQAQASGDTVRSLAKAYVKNNSCIEQYRLLVEKQIKHKQETKALFDGREHSK